MSFEHLFIRDVEGERRVAAADLPLRVGTGSDCGLRDRTETHRPEGLGAADS